MHTPISSMMSSPAWTVGMDDKVDAVEALMTRHGLSWVPVMGPDELIVGVLALSDLLQFHIRKNDPAQTAAWQICSYKPISVAADTRVEEVARLMVEQKSHHVIVTRGEIIVGVVSALDFVRRFTLDADRAGSGPTAPQA